MEKGTAIGTNLRPETHGSSLSPRQSPAAHQSAVGRSSLLAVALVALMSWVTSLSAAPPVQITVGNTPAVRLDYQHVPGDIGQVEVPIWIRGATGSDGLQVSIDYDEVYMGYAWYRTSHTNWRVERVAPYGRDRITFILRQNNKNLLPQDPLEEEIALHAVFYLKEASPQDIAESFRKETRLSLGAQGPQGSIDSFFFNIDASNDNYKPVRTRTSDGGVTIYFRDGVEIGGGLLTRTEQAFSLPLYLTYLDSAGTNDGGADPAAPVERVFTVSIDYDEVFLGLVGIMGRNPPLEGPEAEHPVAFERVKKGSGRLQLRLLESMPRQSCRLHVADLFFKYTGLPPDDDRMLIEPTLELPGLLAADPEVDGENKTDGGAAAHSPGTEPGIVEFLPAHFVRGNVDSSAARNGRGVVNFVADPTDVILILEAVFLGGRALPCADAADANDNGRIELSDAVSILNHLFRGGPPPVSPYPAPGVDADATDTLGCDRPVPYFQPSTRR